jgi:hypothetical protein
MVLAGNNKKKEKADGGSLLNLNKEGSLFLYNRKGQSQAKARPKPGQSQAKARPKPGQSQAKARPKPGQSQAIVLNKKLYIIKVPCRVGL